MSLEAKKSARLILVEDRLDDARLFELMVRDCAPATEVVVLRSGPELIGHLKETSSHHTCHQVILLDINMPGMTGLQCLAELKTHPIWKKIPVVILTSSAAPRDIAHAYESYASSYVQKPLEVEEFRRVVKTICDYWTHAVTLAPDA